MRIKKIGFVLSWFSRFLVTAGIALTGCHESDPDGKALAKQYCGSCHVYPDPSLLPKSVWKKDVLPAMAAFANLRLDASGTYEEMSSDIISQKPAFMRNIRFSIMPENWKKLVGYYVSEAPEVLKQNDPGTNTLLRGFEVIVPRKFRKANTTCLFTDTLASTLYVGDLKSEELNIYDDDLQLIGSVDSAKTVVDIVRIPHTVKNEQKLLVTHLGSFNPSPLKHNGFVELIETQRKSIARRRIADSLDRPVQSLFTDVDQDGLQDVMVCEFGFLTGHLTLFRNTGHGYEKKFLSNRAGPERIYEDDINHDGFPDYWVLFAAGYEGIVQFINDGKGAFAEKEIISFPPSFGSTNFSLIDFDKDGDRDILYSCGDNADLSQVLKPYHGIYLFENTGHTFQKSLFIPMNGCVKAVAMDFDQDGLTDIAAISFFPEYSKRPEDGFVLFRNNGNHKFTRSTFFLSASGRWSCMDVNDLDHDGDPDIILGNLAARPDTNKTQMRKWLDGPEFILLRNTRKR